MEARSKRDGGERRSRRSAGWPRAPSPLGSRSATAAPAEPSAASQADPGQLAGERLVVGFPGTTAPASVRRSVREGGVSGVILFDGNLPSRAAGRRLIRGLQAIPRPPGLRDPLLVMIDQEGGLVKRIGGRARRLGRADGRPRRRLQP